MHNSRRALLIVAALVMFDSACSVVGEFETYRRRVDAGPDPATRGQNTDGIGICSDVGEAPGVHGPDMLTVQAGDGSCFWIDATEVTVDQYAIFLRDGDPASQSTLCEWNVPLSEGRINGSSIVGSPGFAPPEGCASQADIHFDRLGSEASQRPITCVDWCDALAFCTWAGKDLCYDDGRTGLLTQSDWVAACAGGQKNPYGIRDLWEAGICNDGSVDPPTLEPAARFLRCFVPSANGQKVFDMTGNAAEWVNSCNPNTEDGHCAYRGGDYESNADARRCDSLAFASRMQTFPKLGFRCCAKAIVSAR